MKRLAMICSCLAAAPAVAAPAVAAPLVAAPVLAAPVVAAPAAVASRPRTVAPLPPRDTLGPIACHQAVNPLQRDVSVQATMRPVTDTQTLEIKFSLSYVAAGEPSTAVVAAGLGQWLTPSDPTLGQRPGDIWELSKPVYNLGGGSYQYAVAFRWLGSKGKVLQTATLDSSSCTIKELRPDLAMRSVEVKPVAGVPQLDRYLALIVNQGLSASGPFSVLFDPGVAGASTETKSVGSLAPGKSVIVQFSGPACDAASPPAVVANPTGSVDESQRSNNALTVACPAG